jgi:Zn finger protein HypA/HybF involved in hydrogenase expression
MIKNTKGYRKCLKCDCLFASSSASNRICNSCSRKNSKIFNGKITNRQPINTKNTQD